MNKEEILNKYGVVLENFSPAPGAAIKLTIDQDIISPNELSLVMEGIHDIYPDHSIFTTFKGIDIK